MKAERVSEGVKASEMMKPPKRGRGMNAVSEPATRHNKFQLGSNPMEMTEFEKNLAFKEKAEREIAKQVYVRGVQGSDGGRCIEPNFSL